MDDFMEDIDEKERLKGDKKIPGRILLRRALAYVRPYAGKLALAGLLIIVNVALDIALPVITSKTLSTSAI